MSLPKISRNIFLQASAVFTGAAIVGCDPEEPAGVDAGGRTDSGTGRTDSGTGGTDSGMVADSGAGGTDGGTGGTDAGSGDAGGAATCSGANITAEVGNNHGHVLMIPVADIMNESLGDQTYTTTRDGTPGLMHDHMVTITAAQFAMLRSGGIVRVNACPGFGPSSNHEFAISCGPVTANLPVCP